MSVPECLASARSVDISASVQQSVTFMHFTRLPVTREVISQPRTDEPIDDQIISLLMTTLETTVVTGSDALQRAFEFVSAHAQMVPGAGPPHWLLPAWLYAPDIGTVGRVSTPAYFFVMSGVKFYINDDRIGVTVAPSGFIIQGTLPD